MTASVKEVQRKLDLSLEDLTREDRGGKGDAKNRKRKLHTKEGAENNGEKTDFDKPEWKSQWQENSQPAKRRDAKGKREREVDGAGDEYRGPPPHGYGMAPCGAHLHRPGALPPPGAFYPYAPPPGPWPFGPRPPMMGFQRPPLPPPHLCRPHFDPHHHAMFVHGPPRPEHCQYRFHAPQHYYVPALAYEDPSGRARGPLPHGYAPPHHYGSYRPPPGGVTLRGAPSEETPAPTRPNLQPAPPQSERDVRPALGSGHPQHPSAPENPQHQGPQNLTTTGYQVRLSNIPPELTARDLAEAFAEVSQSRVESVDLLRDAQGRPTSESVVVFGSMADAQNTVRRYHGGDLNGRRLMAAYEGTTTIPLR